MVAKKPEEKQARTKKKSASQVQNETDPFKIFFDRALLKAREINRKYDINKPENRDLIVPKK